MLMLRECRAGRGPVVPRSASLGGAERAVQQRELLVGTARVLARGQADARRRVLARVPELPVQRRTEAVGVVPAEVAGRTRARAGFVERAEPYDPSEPVEVEGGG